MRFFLITTAIFLMMNTVCAQPTSSLISLPGKGEIKPQPIDPLQPAETFTVILDKLIKSVQYDVTCIISNNNAEPVDMRFDISQPLGGGYGLFSLNNIELENNQGTILVGNNNIITVPVFVYDTGSSIIFKNLDFKNSVTLNACSARPIVKTLQSVKRTLYTYKL